VQDASGTQRPVLESRFIEAAPALSPDGRFLAYMADLSGTREVYLVPADGKGMATQVSNSGGGAPKWSRDGRILMWRKGRSILEVGIEDGRPVGEPRERFAARNLSTGLTYELAPDGDALYAVQLGENSIPREIRVITGYFEQIRRATDKGAKP
jgi:hypothetical protein